MSQFITGVCTGMFVVAHLVAVVCVHALVHVYCVREMKHIRYNIIAMPMILF